MARKELAVDNVAEAYLALLAAALVWRFASGRWRNIDLIEPEATIS